MGTLQAARGARHCRGAAGQSPRLPVNVGASPDPARSRLWVWWPVRPAGCAERSCPVAERRSPEAPRHLASQLSGQRSSCGSRPHTAGARAGLARTHVSPLHGTPVWSRWWFLSPRLCGPRPGGCSLPARHCLLSRLRAWPGLVCCPLGLPDKPGVAPRCVQVQSWLPAAQGVGDPLPPESTKARPRRGLHQGPWGCTSPGLTCGPWPISGLWGVLCPFALGLGQWGAEMGRTC